MTMEEKNKPIKNKGGRPKKDVVKEQRITLKCSSYEKLVVKAKAKKEKLSVSEYLLQLGLTRKIVSKVKTLPNEVLAFIAELNHIGVNLNQLARKHNSVIEVLTPLDRAKLLELYKELKELVTLIRNYLQ